MFNPGQRLNVAATPHLVYFAGVGGRAEPTRFALKLANVRTQTCQQLLFIQDSIVQFHVFEYEMSRVLNSEGELMTLAHAQFLVIQVVRKDYHDYSGFINECDE